MKHLMSVAMAATLALVSMLAALMFGLANSAAAQSTSMAIEFTNIADGGDTQRVVVFVGETPCASVSFGSITPPATVIGADAQPTECSMDGAEVTFLQFRSPDQQLELSERTIFVTGTVFELANWAPQLPRTALPVYIQAFIDTGTVTVIQPADNGSAGLKSARTSPPGTLLVLATILVLAVSRRLTSGGPD
jgi:hypothetical protein